MTSYLIKGPIHGPFDHLFNIKSLMRSRKSEDPQSSLRITAIMLNGYIKK